MSLLLSPIQIGKIQILKSSFAVLSEEINQDAENNISIGFDASDITDCDNDKKRLEAMLSVDLEPKEDSDEGYVASVAVRGIFLGDYLEEAGTEEEFQMFMKVNSYSQLYGFVRNHIQQISSLSPFGQVSLPCIDVQSIAEDLVTSESVGEKE